MTHYTQAIAADVRQTPASELATRLSAVKASLRNAKLLVERASRRCEALPIGSKGRAEEVELMKSALAMRHELGFEADLIRTAMERQGLPSSPFSRYEPRI